MVRQLEKEILDSLPSAILYLDRAGRVRYLNQGAVRLLDVPREAAEGAYFRELLPSLLPESSPVLREPLEPAFTPATARPSEKWGIVDRKSGSRCRYRCYPITLQETGANGTLMLLEEIPDGPEASSPSPPAPPPISALDGPKIGHTLNQSLQVIMGCLSLLSLELNSDHPSQKYLANMLEQVEKLRLLAFKLSQRPPSGES